ncbi:MAG: GDPmannose 4,6-dehydratase [Candidatus Woesebacteria bacterium GW2011_GWC1_42_9]|nr:MAG: GDPmannose 4,6-dehydratase [Candidatus Woesebacteria bacterium GW2011_GWC1_42_9]
MKFLITGITGFAGAHMANLLIEQGHDVYGLVRGSNGMESDILDTVSQHKFDKIKFLYGNLEDRMALRRVFLEAKFDGCFALAAQSHPPTSFLQPLDTFRTNIMGMANLISVVEEFNHCKLMFCSTSEVYGNGGKAGNLLRETTPMEPCNPYAVSKAAIDLYMQERMMNKKINGFITRAFSHCGTRRGRNFSISSDAYQIANIMLGNKPPEVFVGNLDTVRVVIDVRDVVNAYYMLMLNNKSSGRIFNVCGDTPRKMAFFTDWLIEYSKIDIKKTISKEFYRPIDISYQHGDSSSLKDITGWRAELGIERTLVDLIQYWLKKLKK